MGLLIAAFASVILATTVVGQGESPACLSALQSLFVSTNCFNAYMSIGSNLNQSMRVPDADIATVCSTTCRALVLRISTECDGLLQLVRGASWDEHSIYHPKMHLLHTVAMQEDYEAAGTVLDIGCVSNGNDSCIQGLILINTTAVPPNSTCTSSNCTACQQVDDLVTNTGCCGNLYAAASAAESSNTFYGSTIDQIYTFCGVTNPGNCTESIGGSGGGAKMMREIGIFTVFIIAAIIIVIV